MTAQVRVEYHGPAAIVWLERPERMNALSQTMVRELGEVGRALQQATQVRAVVLTGTGERAFCAGADLKERLSLSEPQILELLGLYRSELAWLSGFRAPVIAAINGVALGGGLELALACDLRIAHERAELGLPETSLAIIPAAGGTQRLPRIIGEAKAKELILLGSRLGAEQALAIGLVNRLVRSDQDLIGETLAWIRPILQGAPLAQAAALRAIRASSLPVEQGLDEELAAYETCLSSEDRKEALQAFAEKRKPIFSGR